MNRVWITWETQRRNPELARAFHADYRPFDYSRYGAMSRYFISATKTLRLLCGLPRGSTVFAQCPSLGLVFLLSLTRSVKHFNLVIDAHNAAFDYLHSSNWFVRTLVRYSFARANVIIISHLAIPIPENLQKKVVALPDRIPEIGKHVIPKRLGEVTRPVITLISSFAADEPIEEFIEAIAKSPEPFTLFVTGSLARAGALARLQSEKIRFTDFLAAEEYEALIQHSDLLVDLTTREDCLVCGAYEALAVGVPMVLSDHQVLRETFSQGYLFSANDQSSYQKVLGEFLGSAAELREQIKAFRRRFAEDWAKRLVEVELKLGKIEAARYTRST